MKIASILFGILLTVNVWASKVEVDVIGMTCAMCIDSITKELKDTQKAENISVNIEERKVRFDEIKGKKISDVEIKSAIKKAGSTYEAVKVRRK